LTVHKMIPTGSKS